MLTAERVREVLHYDRETGEFRWAQPVNARIVVGDIAGGPHCRGYWWMSIDGRRYLAHRVAWLHVHGEWPALQVDHIKGNRRDNRIANLRQATQSQNNGNSSIRRNNRSGHKGVCWSKKRQKWVAQIMVNGRTTHLGHFTDVEVAAAAYRQALERHHGRFADHLSRPAPALSYG